MLRFVILEHAPGHTAGKPLHWDLMLETETGLLTWALTTTPTLDRDIQADPLPIHRKRYLDYEGPISGERGSVTQWDTGTFHWLQQADPLVARLQGQRLDAIVSIYFPTNAARCKVRFGKPELLCD